MSGAAVKLSAGEPARFFTFGATRATTTTTVQASNVTYAEAIRASFQAFVVGTGTVTATVQIQATLDELTVNGTNSNWITLGSIILSGTTTTTDGFSIVAPWRGYRANVTAITGTGATLTVLQGV
jgi:hypothetical protein